mmetsp:Transcript_121774/g.315983  ORF Transcript_121774/g.315983 Transcript_121774/m.315983 type:complete len:417 (+) Transcript_121774:110-1360(+)
MIIVGVLLAILAAALGTTSKQLIAASEHLKKPWLFHLGAGMNIAVGPIVDASAYAFAPQVIVAPFACLDVIFNALTAPYTLRWQNERLTRSHITGTALVALGAVFTSIFADVDNKVYSVRELEDQLFFRPTSLVYLLIELSAIGTVNVLLRKRLLSPAVRGISLGVIAGVLMGNVFFLKGLIGIIQTTASTGEFDAWLRPTPYILAAAAAGGAVCGHLFMRKGLGEYKGVFMVTIFEGAHISAACLSGCVVMEEMVGAKPWRYIMYWLSVGGIVAGMLVINKAAADAQIEGKFHIAQSFAEIAQDDEPRAPTIGRPALEDDLELQPLPQDQDLSKGRSTPTTSWPAQRTDSEVSETAVVADAKMPGAGAAAASGGRHRSSPRGALVGALDATGTGGSTVAQRGGAAAENGVSKHID